MAFTVNGDFLISASRDKTIKIWEVSTGFNVKTITGHSDWVRKARPSPDGQLLCSVGNDQVSECLFVVFFVLTFFPAISFLLLPFFFSPAQSIKIWTYSNQELKFNIREHSHVVECIVWAPESAHAAINELAGSNVQI